jgi:phage N-6-adenine-methyltransferase
MGQERSGLGLASGLRTRRKSAGLTQADLAREAGLSERTVRALERGAGNLASWGRALEGLDLRLSGRNLPPGDTLGTRLGTLRRRRRLSQRALARLVGVTKQTIWALERKEGEGRLATLQAVLDVLGAGAYLAPKGTADAFYTHAGVASVDHSWETPQAVLQPLYGVFGRFDLDPCSPRKARATVRARVRFTAEDDGLSLPWHGVVFVNPPYGRSLPRWVEKAREEQGAGRARCVVALVPARPDTRWWHGHVAGKAAVFFLKGRLRFGEAEQAAPFPSALTVWGASAQELAALAAAFPDAWRTG